MGRLRRSGERRRQRNIISRGRAREAATQAQDGDDEDGDAVEISPARRVAPRSGGGDSSVVDSTSSSDRGLRDGASSTQSSDDFRVRLFFEATEKLTRNGLATAVRTQGGNKERTRRILAAARCDVSHCSERLKQFVMTTPGITKEDVDVEVEELMLKMVQAVRRTCLPVFGSSVATESIAVPAAATTGADAGVAAAASAVVATADTGVDKSVLFCGFEFNDEAEEAESRALQQRRKEIIKKEMEETPPTMTFVMDVMCPSFCVPVNIKVSTAAECIPFDVDAPLIDHKSMAKMAGSKQRVLSSSGSAADIDGGTAAGNMRPTLRNAVQSIKETRAHIRSRTDVDMVVRLKHVFRGLEPRVDGVPAPVALGKVSQFEKRCRRCGVSKRALGLITRSELREVFIEWHVTQVGERGEDPKLEREAARLADDLWDIVQEATMDGGATSRFPKVRLGTHDAVFVLFEDSSLTTFLQALRSGKVVARPVAMTKPKKGRRAAGRAAEVTGSGGSDAGSIVSIVSSGNAGRRQRQKAVSGKRRASVKVDTRDVM